MHKKPTWVKNVKATDKGWVDSDTGELLVAVRGLALEEEQKPETKRKRGRPFKKKETE
jgi:hypothetical protein